MQEPPSIEGFGAEPMDVFGRSSAATNDTVLWGCGPTVLGAILIVILVALPWDQAAIIGMSVVSGICLLIGALVLIGGYFNRNRRIWLFPEGLADCSRKTTIIRWEEIHEIVYWVHIVDLAIMTLDGKEFVIAKDDGIERARVLTEAVMENAGRHLESRILREIETGNTVNFGRIEADRNGLNCHFDKLKSPKAKSFYKGPKPMSVPPLADPSLTVKTDQVLVPWDDFVGLDEIPAPDAYGRDMYDVIVLTKNQRISMRCTPSDLPNSHVLPRIAERLRHH